MSADSTEQGRPDDEGPTSDSPADDFEPTEPARLGDDEAAEQQGEDAASGGS